MNTDAVHCCFIWMFVEWTLFSTIDTLYAEVYLQNCRLQTLSNICFYTISALVACRLIHISLCEWCHVIEFSLFFQNMCLFSLQLIQKHHKFEYLETWLISFLYTITRKRLEIGQGIFGNIGSALALKSPHIVYQITSNSLCNGLWTGILHTTLTVR